MKIKTTLKIGAALLAVAFSTSADAASITGVVGFTGTSVLDNINLASATKVVSWADTQVGTTHTGSFSVLATNQAATFTNGWTFGSGINPLWQVGGFSFNLTSSMIESQNANSLIVAGSGWISGNGYDPTFGTWRYSTQKPSDGVNFEFSSSAAAAVPDGGATVAFLGFSLLGLHGVRRKFGKR